MARNYYYKFTNGLNKRILKGCWNAVSVGCIPHNNKLKCLKIRSKSFDKWAKLPNTAHRLYWKLHPEEYPY